MVGASVTDESAIGALLVGDLGTTDVDVDSVGSAAVASLSNEPSDNDDGGSSSEQAEAIASAAITNNDAPQRIAPEAPLATAVAKPRLILVMVVAGDLRSASLVESIAHINWRLVKDVPHISAPTRSATCPRTSGERRGTKCPYRRVMVAAKRLQMEGHPHPVVALSNRSEVVSSAPPVLDRKLHQVVVIRVPNRQVVPVGHPLADVCR